jgi:PAS domain S-box-containing protein
MVGNSIVRLIPADRQGEETEFLARTNHGESVQQFETVRQAKGERLLDVSVTISPIKDTSGKIAGVSTVARDITWRKNAEDVLRESERRFRDMLENLELIAMTLDKNAKVTFCNDYLLQMTGWQRGEIIGADWFEKFIPDTNVALKKLFFETIEAKGFPSHVENTIKTKSGELREIVWNNTMLRDGKGKIAGTASIGEDVTGHKKLEEQFRQSQKMDAIGQLAGGVAHDFNNILAVIQLQADLLKIGGTLSPAQLEFAEEIGVATQRAAALTRQLLLFSRKEILQLRDLDLNQSINNMTKMLRRILGEDIQMQFRFTMQSLFIHADAGMMDQVLMNLAVNSRDAIPKGGQLVIETSAVEFDQSVRGQSTQAQPGSFVCLSVSDTGVGIPPEILPRIFEPFFTTKDVGKGTGLGLATIFGIVQQHQGWINVESEVGHGTTFRIYLPRLAKMSSQKPEQPALEAMPGGDETILLVEDDLFLCASVRKTLSQLGYRVLEAVNGVEALEVWKQNRDGIHLLLTDLVMPGGINGKELGEQLLKENPKLKVIYASGYSADITGKDVLLKEGVNFLVKPYQVQKLAQVVRNCLDAELITTP